VSGQGSSSSDAIVRIEVYIDDATEATAVLTSPPYRFEIDSDALAPGEHSVRLVRVDAEGRRRERSVPFTVKHEPAVEVHGIEAGATVSGRIDVAVTAPGSQPAPRVARRGPSPWLYILSTVLILGGIWLFFMLVPMYGAIVSSPSGGQSATASSTASAPAVDQQLLKAGGTIYASDCAACHQPSGQGMPPTFPALAGDSFLSDAGAVVKRIYQGSGAMPSHHSYTAKDLAAVATYVRNTWGNGYGGVSVSVAASAEPKASNPAGSPAASSSSGGATAAQSSSAPSTASASPPASQAAASSGGQAGAPSAQALKSQGAKIYSSDCASCHQPNGAGMPPTFPALAGDAYLKDPSAVVTRIFEGKGAMPSHPSYTATDLAAVATFIRESFGNDYGPVTVPQAQQAAPKASQ